MFLGGELLSLRKAGADVLGAAKHQRSGEDCRLSDEKFSRESIQRFGFGRVFTGELSLPNLMKAPREKRRVDSQSQPAIAVAPVVIGTKVRITVSIAAGLLLVCSQEARSFAADTLPSKSTYSKSYGTTKGTVEVDAGKDLPRYPAVEPKDAIATWKIKPGFKLQLAAHEPQVRDPIAISFDGRGRMFVVEMNDYSELRDVTPHLGRVSMLEDKDGDGYYETSTIFADDLPWPTGVICANGGIYVSPRRMWFFSRTRKAPAKPICARSSSTVSARG